MPSQTQPKLQRLRRQLKLHGITQLAIAEAAGSKPPHVCNVLAGRDTSSKVLAAAEKLLAEARDGGRLRPGSPSDPRPETAHEGPQPPRPGSRNGRRTAGRRARAVAGAPTR